MSVLLYVAIFYALRGILFWFSVEVGASCTLPPLAVCAAESWRISLKARTGYFLRVFHSEMPSYSYDVIANGLGRCAGILAP
ncbi:hypothetical protein ASPVEDRAFT_36342 [Aspergillus versicolor CBS 583.65]|uniref:Uncharacterized protein n=1 Tax=Aspergillus versicolor CBS 583.65 TaxID=1036611 RepID=A0A1L9P604_ASPVE|nr:uncharacterized protein ASPVEDRAFT_36342 [Aspergillus versicolor CBS 583.65]OJI96949.1 hypothetical protein ASPVEDRAFT_36342 [Aspergillus versicolor CBS 583.65]